MIACLIYEVVEELRPLLVGRAPGKLFAPGPLALAIDFRLRDHRYLLINVDPALPRLYLIRGRVRDLEKQTIATNQFALVLRKELLSTALSSIDKDQNDRIVRFRFAGTDELGKHRENTLIAQLTGRAANLFWLDSAGVITHQARPARGAGQKVGEEYQPPPSRAGDRASSAPSRGSSATSDDGPFELFRAGEFNSLSEALDAHYTAIATEQAFNTRAAAARAALRKKISRQDKLLAQLQKDLASHADAEQQKRIGDLLLANLSTAERAGNRVKLLDYFVAHSPQIEIDMDEKLTLPQEAARRFALYSRSKRAVQQLTVRIDASRAQLDVLNSRNESLEKIIAGHDETALEKFMALSAPPALSVPPASAGGLRRKPEKKIPGVRRYISSDGFEILVGRAARDNDYLTFKVARPDDLWLHAADYGGSHVVVRNATRKDVPHRTIIEAAQLAAQFSQARKDPKVDVHYTQRKFVSKSKGSAPGLVRLSRFKNITVAPKEGVERIV